MANNFFGSAVPAEALGPIGSTCNLQYNGSGYEAVRQNLSQILMAATSLSASTSITHSGFPLPRDFRVVASLSSGATSKEVVMSLGMHIIV